MQSRYYDFGVDMWAAGCIFSELYNLSPLFPGTSHVHQLSLIMQTLGTPDPDLVRDLASDSAADWITPARSLSRGDGSEGPHRRG